jgi:Class III cytochrome C family
VKVTRTLAVIIGLLLIVAVFAYAAEQTPGTIVLKGAPMGGVKFDHKAHEGRGAKCETCHHASKPEKALKSEHQKCQDCHTTSVVAPMKTKAQTAFHNPAATAGICIDCHKAENAKGKKAPVKCTECHQKANT